MTGLVISVGITMALFVSMYGWGSLLASRFYRSVQLPPAFSAAIGCAAWVVIGGLLNAAGIITAVSLDALVIAGIALALLFVFARKPRFSLKSLPSVEPPFLIIAIATGFFASTISPTAVFNYHDDFHTYLVYPFEMLQTGGTALSSESLLGYGSLTAQSFFQSILLLHLPIRFVNAFDLLFCFFTAGLLLDEIGKKSGLGLPYRALTLVTFIVINPQYVNISSLYSASLMVMGLVYASIMMVETGPRNQREIFSYLVPVAMFSAATAVLKMTFLPFVAVYIAIFVLMLPKAGLTIRKTLTSGVILAAGTLSFALPWVLVSVDSYINILIPAASKLLDIAALPDARLASMPHTSELAIYLGSLSYGGRFIGYFAMIITIVVASLILMRRIFGSNSDRDGAVNIVWVSAFLALLASISLLLFNASPVLVIRYSCALLIAVFPLTVTMLGPSLALQPSEERAFSANFVVGLLLCAQLLVVGQFLDVFAVNLTKAYVQRSRVAFSFSPEYAEFNNKALSRNSRQQIREAQRSIPEGAAVFAWLATPFHLDFARNSIVLIDTPGLAVLNKSVHHQSKPEQLALYFRDRGIRYLMWSRDSFGMRSKRKLTEELTTRRTSARRNLYLIESMDWLARRHGTIFYDGETTVIDLKGTLK